jgi:hypothetical protein
VHIQRRKFAAGLLLAALMFWMPADAPAGTIVIDNFDSPTAGDLFFTSSDPNFGIGSGTVIKTVAPGVIGDERELLVDVQGQAIPISAGGLVGFDPVLAMGVMQVATAGPTPTLFALKYDGFEDEAGLLVDLTDGGENDEFVIRFLSVDGGDYPQGLSLAINVSDGGIVTALYNDFVPDSGSAFDYTVKFSDFTVTGGTSPFDRAASVTFVINAAGAPNVDFKLDFIATVPEPSTAVLLLIGGVVLSLGWKQRRRLRRS